MDRKEFIQAGISQFNINNADAMNGALKEAGFDPLSKAEALMLNEGTFGTNVLQRFKKQGVDFGKSLATLGGMVGQYAINPEARDAMSQQIGQALSNVGKPDNIVDVFNFFAQPYETNLGQIVGTPIEAGQNIVAGSVAHPLDTTLDALGLGAGKLIGKGVKGVGKLGIKAAKTLPETNIINKAARTIEHITSPTAREINEILNVSRDIPSKQLEELRAKHLELQKASDADLQQAFKNLEESSKSWTGSESQLKLTQELKNFGTKVDEAMKKAGMDPAKTRQVATNQYISRTLKNEAGIDVPLDEIDKVLKDNKLAKQYNLDAEALKTLQAEANQAFDAGLIFPIRHSSTKVIGEKGLVTAEDRAAKALAERRYGTQTYEDLVQGFKQTGYSPLLTDIERAEQALNAVDEIGKVAGKKITSLDELKNLGKDELLISPEILKAKFGKTFGEGGDIAQDIKSLSKGLSKAEETTYLDNLYKINKEDVNALIKAYTGSGKYSNKLIDTLTGIGKTTALATPRYVAGNLITNLGLNAVAGITPLHYTKAILNKDIIPEVLKRSTSYAGYLEKDLPSNSSVKQIYDKLFKDFKKGDIGEKFKTGNLMVNLPIFKLASTLETIDRAANFIKQSERYAKETNRTVKEVIELANKNKGNNRTYREIKRRVDNSLGDYTGRNYYLPEQLNLLARNVTPFYRPYTQGVRVLYQSAQNTPLGLYTFGRGPARYGNEVIQNAQDMGQDTDPVYGGIPTLLKSGRMPTRVTYSPYHAFTAIGEALEKPTETFAGNTIGITPLMALAGYNRYMQEAKLPNEINIGGQQYILDNNGNPTRKVEDSFIDRLKLIVAQSAQSYLSPVNQANAYMLPTFAAMTGQEYRRPSDYSILGQIGDFKLPFLMEGNEFARAKGGDELLMPQLGFSYKDVYPQQREQLTAREQLKVRRTINRRKQRNERR